MKKLLPFVFLIVASLQSNAQHEADKWYFGLSVAIDFTTGVPLVGTGPLQTGAGTSAISDGATGNVLFYTNGIDVWDNNNTVMPNGSGLFGNVSSTHSALVIPSVVTDSLYYIFTTDAAGGANGFTFSMVDMTLNGGNGDVINKNFFLTDSTTEKLAAISNNTGGYWVVMHKWGDNAFYAYNVTSGGISLPVISYVGTVHSTSQIMNTYGQMKFNMCGTKLALAIGYQNTVELFDFDKSTGVFSNPITLSMSDHVYGIEFSRNSNYLYATTYDTSDKLVQFDVSLGTQALILASKTSLSTTDNLYGLQMAPNGKIYVSRSFSSNFLAVIDSPDLPGVAAGYSDTGLDIDPGFMGNNAGTTLPSFPQNFIASALNFPCPLPLGIVEAATKDVNPVFPNPSSNEFSIALTNADITVYDCTGKMIQQQKGLNGTFHFGKEYPKGIYLLTVKEGEKSYSQRVVKL